MGGVLREMEVGGEGCPDGEEEGWGGCGEGRWRLRWDDRGQGCIRDRVGGVKEDGGRWGRVSGWRGRRMGRVW